MENQNETIIENSENTVAVLPPKKEKAKKSLIGGQALLEGVMMRSGTSMALAVRDASGNILLETKRLKGATAWYKKVPIVRGVVAFVNSLISSVGTTTKAAEALMMEDDALQCTVHSAQCTINDLSSNKTETQDVAAAAPGRQNNKTTSSKKEKEGSGGLGIMAFVAVFIGLALGIGLFFAVPFFVVGFIEDYVTNILLISLIEGGIRIVIFILYLLLTALMPDIRRMFGYHGAEHRVISCFEKGLPLTVENAQTMSTRHNRCGTTFLFFVMTISILVFSLVTWVLDMLGFNDELITNGVLFFLARMGIRLSLLPFVAGLSFELLKLLAMLPDNWFTTIIRAPGLALQKLTTFKATNDMTEVALVAYNEVTKLDENPNLKNLTFGQFRYKDLRPLVEEKLAEVGAETAETDWIFCHLTGYKRSELDRLNLITYIQYGKLKQIILRRTAKPFLVNPLAPPLVGPVQQLVPQPLWYVLGEVEFYNQTIKVDNRALIPRPETEYLCETAIREIERRIEKSTTGIVDVLDLCTGTGAIAKVVAKNTNANVVASDISDSALQLAKINLESITNVEIIKSNLFENLSNRKFDIIISNPPYIKTSDIGLLQIEVKDCEPHLALDGGDSGLDFYKRIAGDIKHYLNKNGTLMVEVGERQAADVKKLFSENLSNISVIKDLEGIERIVIAILN